MLSHRDLSIPSGTNLRWTQQGCPASRDAISNALSTKLVYEDLAITQAILQSECDTVDREAGKQLIRCAFGLPRFNQDEGKTYARKI
jgi:hypothetical protein